MRGSEHGAMQPRAIGLHRVELGAQGGHAACSFGVASECVVVVAALRGGLGAASRFFRVGAGAGFLGVLFGEASGGFGVLVGDALFFERAELGEGGEDAAVGFAWRHERGLLRLSSAHAGPVRRWANEMGGSAWKMGGCEELRRARWGRGAG